MALIIANKYLSNDSYVIHFALKCTLYYRLTFTESKKQGGSIIKICFCKVRNELNVFNLQ